MDEVERIMAVRARKLAISAPSSGIFGVPDTDSNDRHFWVFVLLGPPKHKVSSNVRIQATLTGRF
jgi:hypothetical protein